MKLQKINEVNEKIIELREEQLAELKKDRDWLKGQIERLEQRSEREQVLHLSETELMRQMLEFQLAKTNRSPVRATLEWFGVLSPETATLPPQLSRARSRASFPHDVESQSVESQSTEQTGHSENEAQAKDFAA